MRSRVKPVFDMRVCMTSRDLPSEVTPLVKVLQATLVERQALLARSDIQNTRPALGALRLRVAYLLDRISALVPPDRATKLLNAAEDAALSNDLTIAATSGALRAHNRTRRLATKVTE